MVYTLGNLFTKRRIVKICKSYGKLIGQLAQISNANAFLIGTVATRGKQNTHCSNFLKLALDYLLSLCVSHAYKDQLTKEI